MYDFGWVQKKFPSVSHRLGVKSKQRVGGILVSRIIEVVEIASLCLPTASTLPSSSVASQMDNSCHEGDLTQAEQNNNNNNDEKTTNNNNCHKQVCQLKHFFSLLFVKKMKFA